jgi:hypothetical protein
MHGDSRVQYFDPIQILGKAGIATPLAAATDEVAAMLNPYMRIYV